MTRAHRKGANADRAVAKTLRTERVTGRERFESAPDVRPVRLPSGAMLTIESKARSRVPRWLVAAVEQAAKYLPGAVPVAVVSGGPRRLAVLPLIDLARLVGLRALEPQTSLALAPVGATVAAPVAEQRDADHPSPQTTEAP